MKTILLAGVALAVISMSAGGRFLVADETVTPDPRSTGTASSRRERRRRRQHRLDLRPWSSDDWDTDGGFAGATGYNFQTGPWVLGVEGDFDWADISGDTDCPIRLPCEFELDWFATIRPAPAGPVDASCSTAPAVSPSPT